MFWHKDKRGFPKSLAAILIGMFVLASVIVVDTLEQSPVQAQGTSDYTIYIPLSQGLSPAVAGEAADEEVGDTFPDTDPSLGEEWATYTSIDGGYSFRYPADWTLKEYNTNQAVVELSIPSDARETRITFGYLAFEKPETEDLQAWAHYYFNESPAAGRMGRVFASADLNVKVPDGESQQIYFQSVPEASDQGYLITHGRLVLNIGTLVSEESLLEIFDIIANSITFMADAPRNTEQLYAPEPPPANVTLDDLVQFRAELEKVTLAINMRLETGEDPIELLETMPEWAQERYYALLIRDASIIEQIDQQRESPPVVPDEQDNIERLDGQTFEEMEREYYQSLPEEEDLGQDSSLFPEPDAVTIATTPGVANRRGLPARYMTPIRNYSPTTVIKCGSGAHYNGTEDYAVDISVAIGNNVYATTQNEVVEFAGWDSTGYGNMVITWSENTGAGVTNSYKHIYAHLDQIFVSQYDVLQPASLIGKSGNTGTTGGPHLHFSIAQAGLYPVDLSPMKGIAVNLKYPLVFDVCGKVENPDNADAPIIIEANEFQGWYVGTHGMQWTCSQYYPNHTGYCYRAVTPQTPPHPEWNHPHDYLTDANKHETSRISYQVWIPVAGTYFIWVCGMGGNIKSDSLYMGKNDSGVDSQIMVGYESTNWVWRSIRLPDTWKARLYLPYGYQWIDMWARENTMRVDRILLVRDGDNYNPITAGVRCGGQGLY